MDYVWDCTFLKIQIEIIRPIFNIFTQNFNKSEGNHISTYVCEHDEKKIQNKKPKKTRSLKLGLKNPTPCGFENVVILKR
jgi:hypothetical protein